MLFPRENKEDWMRKRTGIVAHDRHLQMPNWEEVMWGAPPYLLGQFPKAISVALQEDAEIMVLCSGVRSGINGEMDSVANYQYILDNFHRLSEFFQFGPIALGRAKEKIEKILVLDKESLNTTQEVSFSGNLFEGAGIERVIGVTAPTHAPRCLNEMLKFYGRPRSKIAVSDISVQVSDIGWAPNDDVVVFEPPHRPDDSVGDVRVKVAKTLLRPEKLLEAQKALGL